MSQQNAQEESHSVQEFAEQFVESLQPRQERYETRLGDDFYVCTWPNGIKTWLFVYEVDGYRRRRTLGTYPEMSLTDAREALFAARKLQRAEEELIERGLGDAVMRGKAGEAARGQESRSAPSGGVPLGRRVARTLGTAAAGAVVAVGAMFGYAALTTGQLGFLTNPTSPAARLGAAPKTGTVPESSRVADAAGSVAGAASAGGEARDTRVAAAGQDAADEPDERLLQLRKSLAGTVSRAMLAESVANGEPYGELTDLIRLERGESLTVHFFTEVRGLENQQMQHRWIRGREVVETIDLRTGSSWRYPLSSSIRLDGNSSTGRWTVELRDAEGELIEDAFFTVENMN